MTTLVNRPNTALLVVDIQSGVVEGAHRRNEVVTNVDSLVGEGRGRKGLLLSGLGTQTKTLFLGLTTGRSFLSWSLANRKSSSRSTMAIPSRKPPWKRYWRNSGSGTSSLPGLRPTPAFARPSTAHLSEATT